MKCDIVSFLLPLSLLLSLYSSTGIPDGDTGLGSQFAQRQHVYQSDRIPLSLLPSRTSLRPGEYVIVSVSDVWSTSSLTWRMESSMTYPGSLSDETGPTVVYTAPYDVGEVVVRVQGTMAGVRNGEGWITFSVRP